VLFLLLLAALPLRGEDARELVAEGQRLRDAGQLDEAVAQFRRAVTAAPQDPEPALLLAETIAWQKRFDEAERIYREALDRFGPSRAAQLGLGRVLLWKGEYAGARRTLSQILRESPGDLDAREELARAWYWSGDFRRAEREFREVVAGDPSREGPRRELSEIREASAPSFAVRALHRSDDQPFQLDRAEVELSLFSDPLTRWTVTAGAYRMDDPSESAPYLEAETEITLPAARITIAPALRLLSFPDGEDELLGGVRIARRIGTTSTISVVARRHELLLNRGAADDHPWVTNLNFDYELAAEGWIARARAGTSRFFDGNDGAFADAYVLAPLYRGGSLRVSLGAAAAYRDTGESRFRADGAVAEPRAPGIWSYRWEGVYDPYWSPHRLEEIRAIASVGSAGGSRIVWNVQISGGSARDRAVGFGPRTGASPLPPPPFEVGFKRTYQPWTASAWAEIPIAPARKLRFDYEHMRSVYYEADEFRAALVGRF
jgi:tetratricopeptide (TPR) repeat protein